MAIRLSNNLHYYNYTKLENFLNEIKMIEKNDDSELLISQRVVLILKKNIYTLFYLEWPQ